MLRYCERDHALNSPRRGDADAERLKKSGLQGRILEGSGDFSRQAQVATL